MAYFGTEFQLDKEENFAEFLSAIGLSDDDAKEYLEHRPILKFVKIEDSYVYAFTTPQGLKDFKFESGVPFEEEVREGVTAQTTITVDGDTITQVQDFGDKGTITYKREFSDDGLKVTATASGWDGEAVRYYVPLSA